MAAWQSCSGRTPSAFGWGTANELKTGMESTAVAAVSSAKRFSIAQLLIEV
jgi:hypothetical protein